MADCSHDWATEKKQTGTTNSGDPIITVIIYCTKCGATA
jgi:hypothetical protein